MDKIVILEIQGVSIKCNRANLIAHSDYFKAMFEGNFVESNKQTIPLKNVEAEAMNTILKLLWDPEYPIEEESVLSVLQASCMLQFLKIQEKCIRRIEELLNVKNCLKFWLYTEQLGVKNCKAKLLALMEFESVKESDYFLEMNSEEIFNYLGNIYLQCQDEMEVFKAMMKWYENSDEKSEKTLLKLLKCLDFTQISDIEEIISHEQISQHAEIVHILKKKNLFQCKSRNKEGFPCFLVDNFNQNIAIYSDKFKRKRKYSVLENDSLTDSAVVSLNTDTSTLEKIFLLDPQICSDLDGFKMISYKQFIYLFGGEFLLGKGVWNYSLYVYDVIKKNWNKKTCKLPYPRRHFETCLSQNNLFIIGGTGPFRVIQENIFWYNLKNERWSKEHRLPCSGRQIKCCQLNNKLFVLNIPNKCGYIFDCLVEKWTKIEICDEDNVLPSFSSKLSLFSYRNSVFIKEDKLFKLIFKDDRLVVDKQFDINDGGSNVCETNSILCGNKVYTLSKCEESGVNLSVFNVDKVESGDDYVEIVPNGEFTFKSSLIMFHAFHPIFNNDELICDL